MRSFLRAIPFLRGPGAGEAPSSPSPRSLPSLQELFGHIPLPSFIRKRPNAQGRSEPRGISFWGGLTLLIGSMTGPGLVMIPLLFQQAGWLTPTLCFLVASILSSIASSFVCEAMNAIPGNAKFEKQVEFATLMEMYFGRRWRAVAHLWLYASLQSTNIASIIISAQAMDNLVIAVFGKSCALQLAPTVEWTCVSSSALTNSPFETTRILFSIGYFVAMSITVPLCFIGLIDNIRVQIASLLLLLLVTIVWAVIFIMQGLDPDAIPAVGTDHSSVIGTVLFNYAYVTTIPSWVNAKKPSVGISSSIWTASIVSTAIYFVIGILGGMSFAMPNDSNILSVLNSPDIAAGTIARISVFIFPVATLVTSIPVYTIVVRYNLVRGRVCGRKLALVLSVAVPWLIAIIFQTGSGLNDFVNWSSLIFTGISNFIIPFVLYLCARRQRLLHPTAIPVIVEVDDSSHSSSVHPAGEEGGLRRRTRRRGGLRRSGAELDGSDVSEEEVMMEDPSSPKLSFPPITIQGEKDRTIGLSSTFASTSQANQDDMVNWIQRPFMSNEGDKGHHRTTSVPTIEWDRSEKEGDSHVDPSLPTAPQVILVTPSREEEAPSQSPPPQEKSHHRHLSATLAILTSRKGPSLHLEPPSPCPSNKSLPNDWPNSYPSALEEDRERSSRTPDRNSSSARSSSSSYGGRGWEPRPANVVWEDVSEVGSAGVRRREKHRSWGGEVIDPPKSGLEGDVWTGTKSWENKDEKVLPSSLEQPPPPPPHLPEAYSTSMAHANPSSSASSFTSSHSHPSLSSVRPTSSAFHDGHSSTITLSSASSSPSSHSSPPRLFVTFEERWSPDWIAWASTGIMALLIVAMFVYIVIGYTSLG